MSRSASAPQGSGEIEFLLGKPELVAKGHFDDIDMAMMIHVGSHDQMTKRSLHRRFARTARWSSRSASCGRASHAGGAPQLGINALSAAMIALNAIHCQRETFWDKDTIRIHPIITKGGDAVSVVPAEVTMETFVRGGSRGGDPRRQHEGRPLPAGRRDGDGRRGRDQHDPRLPAAAQRPRNSASCSAAMSSACSARASSTSAATAPARPTWATSRI